MDEIFSYANDILNGTLVLFGFVLGVRIAGTVLLFLARAVFGIVSTAKSAD